ncbi:MAG: hypothetical protein ACK5V3_05650 [Bdellovibrionales bacterium]
MENLLKLGVYAKTRGHWLLDAKVVRTWLVPTGVALAGIYAHLRHDQLIKEAVVRHNRGLPLTTDQRNVLMLSNRGRYVSAFLSAGVFGLIGYVATEIKHTRDIKQLDASSEDEIIRRYQDLLCEVNQLGLDLGYEPLKNAMTNQAPECQ